MATSENNPFSEAMIAFICDERGVIQHVIRDDLNPHEPIENGRLWISMLDPSCLPKALTFFTSLRTQQALSGWELNLRLASRLASIQFTGGRVGDRLLIVGVHAPPASEQQYLSQLLEINNEQTNMLRMITKQREHKLPAPQSEKPYYEELSRLNNELINLQRDLARKNAELVEHQHMLKHMIESSPSILYTYDLILHRVTFANSRVQVVLGYKAEEFLEARVIQTMLHPEDVEPYRQYLDRCAHTTGEEVQVGEFRVRDAWDRWRWLLIHATVFSRDEDGRPTQMLCTGQDISERKEAQEKLEALSKRDMLTGLYNRGYFEEEMDRIESGSEGYPVTIVIADMDGLKRVNDRFGHSTGDDLLRRGAAFLVHMFRTGDVIARLGGDEFGVLLRETSLESARAILNRVREQMLSSQAADHPVQFSIGYATAAEGQPLREAVKLADQRMYLDKEMRRGQKTVL